MSSGCPSLRPSPHQKGTENNNNNLRCLLSLQQPDQHGVRFLRLITVAGDVSYDVRHSSPRKLGAALKQPLKHSKIWLTGTEPREIHITNWHLDLIVFSLMTLMRFESMFLLVIFKLAASLNIMCFVNDSSFFYLDTGIFVRLSSAEPSNV